MRMDLNADVGESFGVYAIGDDEGLMASVTSVSVAAGLHGGDPSVLRETIRRAKSKGIAIGAHPGFADLQGFGRREIRIPPAEIEDLVLYQVAAVAGVAQAEGTRLQHVKPHGALYNLAARQAPVAEAIVRAVVALDDSLILFAPPDSELIRAGEEGSLRVAAEGFADRAYTADGSLAPRSTPGAVLSVCEATVQRAVRIASDGVVETIERSELALPIQTLCVHGDTPGAARLAAEVRRALEAAGFTVTSLR